MSIQCQILQVSETGFYQFKRNLNKPNKDSILSAAIRAVRNQSEFNDNYGVQRIQIALDNRGIHAGIRKITRIMRENGWLHKPNRRPKGLTKATSKIKDKENLIKQNFLSEAPFTKLLTDISQIACSDGKLYISPIMDCYSGEILSLQMRDNMKKELCTDTVKSAVQRFPISSAILHSDRGSQYTSQEFKDELLSADISQSLSGINHCYDNARMESFFATLKKELLYRIPTYKMKKVAVKSIIFRYVFVYYNRMRIYTSNPNGMSPSAYRKYYEYSLLAAA